jgi:3-hydroxymyristoyl/3-hydroxydecanoyl-(acyl carrier protein) dehydratase
MLVDRVLSIGGEPGSLGAGTIATEHDIRPDAWYLENGRVITSVALEAGQADLLLSGYLGADARTRGLAMYRLLDATVTFHRGLPSPGQTLHYDIAIDVFFRQGDTHLFRFCYQATVDGMPLLTMTDGCAGFFTPAQLAAGKGIVPREKAQPANVPTVAEWDPPFAVGPCSLSESQLAALVDGDLVGCFGEHFARVRTSRPLTLPGGLLKLLDRVTLLDPRGGHHGLGLIRAEQDIDPSAWFLTCHFVDDHVMPGTLMLEVSLQAFRILLLQLGWVAEAAAAHFEPVPGITARLRCRGQVTGAVRTAAYEIIIKRIGFDPDAFAVADALLYADGRPIVEISNLSLRLEGVDREHLERIGS